MTIQGPYWKTEPEAMVRLARAVAREQYGSMGPTEALAAYAVMRHEGAVALLDAAATAAAAKYAREAAPHIQALEEAAKRRDAAVAEAVKAAAKAMKTEMGSE